MKLTKIKRVFPVWRAFATSDGMVFADHSQAKSHQFDLNAAAIADEFLKEYRWACCFEQTHMLSEGQEAALKKAFRGLIKAGKI